MVREPAVGVCTLERCQNRPRSTSHARRGSSRSSTRARSSRRSSSTSRSRTSRPASIPSGSARPHGRAVDLLVGWCAHAGSRGCGSRSCGSPGRTPLIFIEVPGAARRHGAALRPPRQAARDDRLARGPRARGRRCCEGDRLYGRGGADDGYSIFASLTALEALCKDQAVPHARCVVLIEACEESGSGDLPAYIEHLRAAHRHAVARRLPRLRLRQLRPAVVHDVAARPGDRQPRRSSCSPRACTPATARGVVAVELARDRASLLDRLEDSRHRARSSSTSSHAQIPRAARRAGAARRRGARRRRSASKFPLQRGRRAGDATTTSS